MCLPVKEGKGHDTGEELCHDKCMMGLMGCADDPTLTRVLSAHQIKANKALRDSCRPGGVIDWSVAT